MIESTPLPTLLYGYVPTPTGYQPAVWVEGQCVCDREVDDLHYAIAIAYDLARYTFALDYPAGFRIARKS